MISLLNDLATDDVVIALAIITFAWLLAAIPASWFMLRVLDWQRVSEFPRVLWFPVWLFLLTVLLLSAAPHVKDSLDSSIGSSVVEDFSAGAVVALLRLASAATLWWALYSALELTHQQFFRRRYRAFGRERQRNTSEILATISVALGSIAILVYAAWLFQFNLAAYLVAFGGVSVALAFGLQTIMRNVLSGVALAIEMPFGRDDLIRLSDGPTYQVVRRGLDITEVRDITTHETVYLPNSLFAEKPLIEVTRPTDDLRSVIEVGVAYNSNLREVRSTLLDIAYGHPFVVGPHTKKTEAIEDKITRLYLRNVFDEATQHFAELARLHAERDLNEGLSKLRRRLGGWASAVDEAESEGFVGEERERLKSIAQELRSSVRAVELQTTYWQVMIRNCVAVRRGADLLGRNGHRYRPGPRFEESETSRTASAGDTPESPPNGTALPADNVRKLAAVAATLQRLPDLFAEHAPSQADDQRGRFIALEKRLRADSPDGRQESSGGVNEDREEARLGNGEPDRSLRAIVALAMTQCAFADLGINLRATTIKDDYESKQFKELVKTVKRIAEAYTKMANDYAEAICKEGGSLLAFALDSDRRDSRGETGNPPFVISACRTRSEDEYKSERAAEYIIDNELCRSMAGDIDYEADRYDLAELFRLWGDKTQRLSEHSERLARRLDEGRSTALDSELRDLGEWIKNHFKESFPPWKNPVTSVDRFDDSSVVVSIRFYVDNVRLDSYQRAAATYTQMRQRIIERFDNAEIKIPFPQRDLHLPHLTEEVKSDLPPKTGPV